MKKFTLYLIFLTAIFFISCSNEDTIKQESSNYLQIEAILQSRTRNVITSDEDFSPNLGLFVINANGESYSENCINTHVFKDGDKWYYEGAPDYSSNIPLLSEEGTVYAYHPYGENNVLNKVNIDITPILDTDQQDYLYGIGRTKVSADFPRTEIVFKHALARVTLSLKLAADDQEDLGVGLQKITLRNNNSSTIIATKGSMNIITGEIIPELNTNAAINLSSNRSINKKEATNIDLLVIPTSFNNNEVAIDLNIENRIYTINLPTEIWKAGQQYTYPITINRKGVNKLTPAKIGDYYYSDHTWSTEYDLQKTCIGIVFALSEVENGQIMISLNESGSLHGRIIALNDLDGEYKWGPEGKINIPHSYMYMYLPIDGMSTYSSTALGDYESHLLEYNFNTWPNKTLPSLFTDYDGYIYSKNLQTSDYPASYACIQYTANGATETGFWYLPTLAEFARLAMASGAEYLLKTGFNPLKKNIYWTASERSEYDSSQHKNVCKTSYCYNIETGKLDGSNRSTSYMVRPIASF